ncbi:MAG: NAD(P)(+) transhydrogenase (Re/Si-specific) subunit beta, partial [Acidimicrobiales bacterium]
ILLAIVMTFATPGLSNFGLIAVAIVIGIVLGLPAARLVKMTAMPQMVAAFNGVGGGAAALIALAEFARASPHQLAVYQVVEVLFGIIVGSVSFAGSIVAFAKLQELMTGRPVTYPGQQVINAVIGGGTLGLAIAVCISPQNWLIAVIGILALLFGIAFVLPIGGADVPVLISLLNSFTGLAVAASGFVLHSVVLVVAGTLVGASGTLLTRMMSAAMGRSLANILFSAFGSVVTATGDGGGTGDRAVKSGSADDIAVLLAYSQKVVIVPGYGLAVAQAQHVARELAELLESRGVEVTYAIHPVAGRMPGHMNVLLAEANVPYEQLKEMDEANPGFQTADVALVVGANDVVNPAAKNSPGSPIYGMPILSVSDAKNVIFLKRSMRPGFAGIDNELLFDTKTTLLFGDAKDSLTKLVAAIKQL